MINTKKNCRLKGQGLIASADAALNELIDTSSRVRFETIIIL